MKVYIVDAGEYENNHVCGVFLALEDAHEALKAAGYFRDPKYPDGDVWDTKKGLAMKGPSCYWDDQHHITEHGVGKLE